MFHFNNENHAYILFLDTEFDHQELVQFAGVLFRRTGPESYAPYRSLNVYIQTPVTAAFTRYTHISTDFLTSNGVTLEDAKWQIDEYLLPNVTDLLVVSHGLHSDLAVLRANGINLKYGAEYCTFEHAKVVLDRRTQLSLDDLAREAVIYPAHEHNAFMDVWLTIGVYNYLKDMED